MGSAYKDIKTSRTTDLCTNGSNVQLTDATGEERREMDSDRDVGGSPV